MKNIKVKLIGDHPHAGEFGSVEVYPNGNVDVTVILGKDMVQVTLDDDTSCYAEARQIEVVKE